MSAAIDTDAKTLFDMGISALENGRYREAEDYFRRTLTLAPDFPEPLLNLGYVLDQQGRTEEALRCYESVLETFPANAKARYNRAVILLRSGDLTNGFADYESRFAAISNTDNRVYRQPRWDGSPLAGHSILVYCEQGLGDAIQFSRYIPWVAKQGGRVTLEVQQPLVSLLSTLSGVDKTVVKSATPPVTDYYIPLLSLPHIFKTTLDTVPAPIPYIIPDPLNVAEWRQKLAGDTGLKVGLAWRGSATNSMDRDRSCPIDEIAPLLSIPGISFYSLQVGNGKDEITNLRQGVNLIDLTSHLKNFSDTAALLANLDLVVSVDTAVVHLAGAMGKPVWIMLAHKADWRWTSGRSTSPWYPTASLFRQPKPGDWRSVISEISQALNTLLSPQMRTSAESIEHSFQLALSTLNNNDPEAAIPILHALARTMPDELSVWFNLGRAYELAGKTADAETALQRAHELKPESIDVLLHLGAALVQQNKVDQAFECCRKMLALQPDNVVARYNLAFLQLRTGNYRAGFANFEARLAIESFAVDTRRYPQPRWDGTPLNGKSILVFGEQGMGDVIQFVRYIPLLIGRGGKVVLEVDRPLVPLLKSIHGDVLVVAKKQEAPKTDFYIQLLSLPYLFGTTVETVPNQVPYIFPDQAKVESWRHILSSQAPGFRIGLVWRGNPLNPLDRHRSCPLAEFSLLGNLSGVSLISLQVGAATADEIEHTTCIKLIDPTDKLLDFSDTAACIANLDLVIGVDTAVTHLAGALGKPVWVILPKVYDWRWLVGRDSSPWYPTGRVFWQPRQGDWTGALTNVHNALKDLLSENLNTPEPLNIETCYMLGAQLKEKGDLAGAERCFRQIVEQAPDLPDPQHSLAVVLHLQGRIAEAISHYRIATTLDPLFVKAHYNLANACQQSGQYQDAIAAVRAVLTIDPLHANAHWLLGALLLRLGRFDSGWQEYEWRWQADGFSSRIPDLGRPLWDGSPLTGKTLLIHMEQGRGDMIQFIRYAPLAAECGARIMVCALPELVPLLATVEKVDLVVDRNGPLPPFDLHIPVQSLPHRLGTTMATIPTTVPYLHAPPAYRAKWADRSASSTDCVRIGLVWEGNKLPDVERSFPPELLAPLLELPHTTFYSLQVGGVRLTSFTGRLIDHSAELCDFADTAALIETLDLVISIDTAVAHLAGALGKPVWTLLPFVPDWRWLLDRNDSPWYPSMRLFRQSSPGNWDGVMNTVQQALRHLLEHRISGIDLLRSGDAAGAEQLFSEEITKNPDNAEAHCNLGVALDTQGRHEEAIACYQAALLLKPDYMQAVYNMGNSWVSLDNPDYAQRCYQHALELSPDLVAAHLALGEIGKNRRDYSLAHRHFQAALLIEPASVNALQGEAETFQAEERYLEAIAAYQQILALEPGHVTTLTLLGSVYQCLEQPEEAEICYRHVLSLEPERPTALNNLGVALNASGKLDEAIAVLRHLVHIHPDYAEGHWNLSVALLAAGQYPEGWQEFEWRFKIAKPVQHGAYTQPRWDGSPLAGRTILLHAEQGFGDTIQFARYVPLVARCGGKVVIECQIPALQRLLLSLADVAQVVASGEPLPPFDCHLPLMSLPLLFGTTVDTIPSQIPYLSAKHADVETWRQRLKPSNKFRIGVVWHAKQSQVLNRKRSCPLQLFTPLWNIPGVEFYTLQIGDGSEQLKEFSPEHEVIDLTRHINDFADTAAFMANLDLVITIDTVTAHLAGALGVPTWVVLPHVAEWRWLQNRRDTPWYPGMRLFRQPARGDWTSLMNSVAGSLHDIVQSHRSGGASLPVIHRQATTHRNAARSQGSIRVGLAWYGRQDNPLNRKRSCPFSALTPLFDLPGITFVNLQLEAPNDMDTRLVDLTGDIRNFEDTAALMANLDLIISIDTSVAHLAAASGRPTWVLLSHVPDWRWLAKGDITPWYPGVRIFRQPDHGDWAAVVQKVAYRLTQLSAGQLDLNKNCDDSMPSQAHCLERQFLEQQLERHLETMRLNAADADTQLDVGVSLALLGRHDEAAVFFRHVLELDSEHNAAHLNLAYSLLTLGTYGEGWQHLEWRLRRIPAGQLPPWPMLRHEQLDSHPDNASVLVHCEQGYGDTIQFARFLPMLADAGFRIIVSCQPPILPLIASIRGVSQVIPHGELLPACTFQVLMLSLAGLFAVELDQVPAPIPYLVPQPHLIKVWKLRLKAQLENRRIIF